MEYQHTKLPRNDPAMFISVLFCFKSQQMAGAEGHVLDVSRQMRDRGAEVTILNLHDAPTSLDTPAFRRELERTRGGGIDVVRQRVAHNASPSGTWATKRLVQKLNPDIVHTHMPYADLWCGIGARLVSNFAGRVISTRHYDYSYSFQERLRWTWYYRLATRTHDCVVAVSEKIARLVTEHERVPRPSVRVIHHGICDYYKTNKAPKTRLREELGISQDKFLVATVARLVEWKGHRYALEAVRWLLDREVPVHWLFVGDGPEGSELKEMCRNLGLKDHIDFLGRREDVDEILGTVDLMVHPTTGEAFGIVLIEAMMHSLPVVATDVGAIPEIVDTGSTGLLVEPRQPQALGQAVAELAARPELRSRMGTDGRRRYTELFTQERMLDDLASLYGMEGDDSPAHGVSS